MISNGISTELAWDPYFFQASVLFSPISAIARSFLLHQHWPTLSDYNQVKLNVQRSVRNYPILAKKTFVKQTMQSSRSAALGYEQRIYLKGEIQTRLCNWHDYLNALVWLTFPRSKQRLNVLQHQLISRCSTKQRTALQNQLAHFDECGVVVIYRQQRYADWLRQHKWLELFWQAREVLLNNMQFFIFGHGLYEKALQPYIGLTGKALVFAVDDYFFTLEDTEKWMYIDELIHGCLNNFSWWQTNKKLQPLPILGIPDWYHQQNKHFYQNASYFRAKQQ